VSKGLAGRGSFEGTHEADGFAQSKRLDFASGLVTLAFMDADEREIFQFLKTWGGTFVGATEIARRAGIKKRFYADPNWAKPVLMQMADRGIVEADAHGRYRIKPVTRKDKHEHWVAPDIAKILQENGLEAGAGDAIAPDEYYDEL
jgi:hypothetical protein